MTATSVQAGYEDVWYYLWRERKLPMNVDPFDARLEDEVERDRLRRVFTQGLDAVVGYALPIRRVGGRSGSWATGRWFLRDERLYLIPGDSPMGLRLPLDSLPWSDADDLLTIDELDPFAPRAPLAVAGQREISSAGLVRGVQGVHDPASNHACRRRRQSEGRDRTGVSHRAANLPPASSVRRCASSRAAVFCTSSCRRSEELEDYLDLVAAVEATSRALGMRVVLEGYPPPSDPRLRISASRPIRE